MGNTFLFLVFTAISMHVFSQREATWWPIGNHVLLDFSTPTPAHTFTSATNVYEASTSISDTSGNLLFYTNGDIIYGANHSPLPNGSYIFPPYSPCNSTTQGALFLKKPGNNSLYYLFTLPETVGFTKMFFQYHCIDKTLNGGGGDVLFHKQLAEGAYLEKMAATKHCNRKDYWVVVARYTKKGENSENISSPIYSYNKHEVEFSSYLVTEQGVQESPVRSLIAVPTGFPFFGQLKFNTKGNELAAADPTGISLLSFDQSTGTIAYKQRIALPLQNGYGIEFSPNDELLYINEKQYHVASNTLTSLLPYNCPAQLQRGPDNKIYKAHFAQNELFYSFSPNDNVGWICMGTNLALRIAQVGLPNAVGLSCQYDTAFIADNNPSFPQYLPIGMPNFPSFYFYHPRSAFSYSTACEKDSTVFYLLHPSPAIDSVNWLFEDGTVVSPNDSVAHYYAQAGTFQVGCITFSQGVSDTTFQCVSVCGKNAANLPSVVNLCDTNVVLLNAMHPCALSYHWNTGDTTSSIRVTEAGEYILQTTTACGTYFDTVKVISDDCTPSVFIPNVITPNDDSANDFFSITVKNVASLRYFIINRWGNVVHEGAVEILPSQLHLNTSLPLWDGKDGNQRVYADGVYFYRIELSFTNAKTSIESGFLHLAQ